jgi:membrane protease YdiL (CAAX protease family)
LYNPRFFSIIRKKPVISFLFFTFTISWVIWILAAIIAGSVSPGQPEGQNGSKMVLSYVSYIGAFGPSLAAILVSSILNPSPSNASRKKRWTIFIIVLSVLCLIFFIQFFLTKNLYIQFILLSMLLSVVAAYVISSVYHPSLGVVNLMRGLRQISAKNVWLWIAFLLPFALVIMATMIDLALGGTEPLNFSLNSLGLMIINYPIILLFGGSLNEEPGWRGFLVPHLQKRFNPFETGLIIGLIWMHWHFPLHFTGFYPVGIGPFLIRFFHTVPFGIIFTWLYNRSKGNLFACILLHTSINSTAGLFGGTSQLLIFLVIIVFAVIVIFYDKMFKKI